MIHIDPATMIGKGSDRACYDHPDDPKKCIKITHTADNKQSQNDLKCYTRLAKQNISWEMLARFYGTVETDMGEGLVFEKVLDFDGSTSKDLNYYLKSDKQMRAISDLLGLLKALYRYLLTEKIVFRDLNADNILYQRITETEGKFMIIDGVGTSVLIPLEKYSDFFARRKIERKWEKLIERLERNFRDNASFMKIIEENRESLISG